MRKTLGFLVLVAISAFALPARADTFNYTLTDSGNGGTWTWSLTGVPHTLPILPQFSTQIGQPGDILVSYDGGPTEPNVMSITATTLLFQCDPTLLCAWDEAAEMEFESTTPLLNGTQLLTGNFTGNNVFFWGSGLKLEVTDSMPELSSGPTLLLGLIFMAGAVRMGRRTA
ncbi:MAG TPA: hypothetical protein VG322_17080 [Candidatus Acidoferrales bacterium]|nr:hypothetical protein [Candidatus Acidoferrales bacterium]